MFGSRSFASTEHPKNIVKVAPESTFILWVSDGQSATEAYSTLGRGEREETLILHFRTMLHHFSPNLFVTGNNHKAARTLRGLLLVFSVTLQPKGALAHVKI